MEANNYSPAARLVKSISVKDIFDKAEPKSLSPYIEMVMNDLFLFTGIDSSTYNSSERELKLINNEKLDIVFSDKEIINRTLDKKSKNICIVENQFGLSDTTHANKIFNYITFTVNACPKVKEIHYFWIAETFTDDTVKAVYDALINGCKLSHPTVNINFHRIQFSVEENNNEVLVVFEDVDNTGNVIKLPYDYINRNNELIAESTLGIDEMIAYPSAFESLTERFIYNKYKELSVDDNKSVLFIDGAEYSKNDPYIKVFTKNIYKGITIEYKRFEDLINMPKFDYIIQNPPYSGILHTDFFKEGLNHLTTDGKMIIIEPATWLINLRTNGNAKKLYPEMKKMVEGHVKSIKIANYNKEFNTGLFVPFSITHIDTGNTYSEIEFDICDVKSIESSLDDCNRIGKRSTIDSIIKKIDNWVKNGHSYMSEHVITDEISVSENVAYLPYNYLLTLHGYNSKVDWVKDILHNKEYYGYVSTCFVNKDENVAVNSIRTKKNGKISDATYCDDYDEFEKNAEVLNNFSWNTRNLNLFHFISLIYNFDSHNMSVPYTPWIADKKYNSDKEIYDMFNFTEDEIKLIENTCNRFERNSDFVKEYMKAC